MRPPLYSKAMVALILFVYFFISCLTASILVRRNYPTEETTGWVFLGGLTAHQVSFRIRRTVSDGLDRLVVSKDANYDNIVFQESLISDTTLPLVQSVTANNLQPNTRYYYATLKDQNNRVVQKGKFQTAPVEGVRTSFQFAASGCAWTASTHDVFTVLKEDHPDSLFLAHLGDLHYEDLNVDSVPKRIQAIDNVMFSDSQRGLFANRPMAYIWDDHDWLGNNAGGDPDQVGYEAALESYRLAMPYYSPLVSNTSMYQAFTIGTVRFVMTDLRSEALEDMYSQAQRKWFYQELSKADQYDFVIWLNSKPWIGEDDPDSDSWMGYPQDRQELSNFIRTNVTSNNLLAISSDAHMVAFDDGSNTYYGSAATDEASIKSFPLLQTGPLDRLGSAKGGPFSGHCHTRSFERNHQYSIIDFRVDEVSNQACLDITAYRIVGLDQKESIFSQTLCGTDIFAETNPGVGSCEADLFNGTNTIMLWVTGGLVLLGMGLTCGVVGGLEEAILTSTMILTMCVATLVAGSMLPLVNNVGQFNATETGIIALLQSGSVVVHLLCWRFLGEKKQTESEEVEQQPENSDMPESDSPESDAQFH